MKKGMAVLLISLLAISIVPAITMASVPKWRILWAILPKVDVMHTDGTQYKFSLTREEIAKVREMSERTEQFIESASDNAVDIEMTVVESRGTVTSLTEDSSWIFIGEDDFPSDVKREISRAEEAGTPYQLKAATFRLNGENPKLNSWLGLGGGRYARVRFMSMEDYTVSETRKHPEEVWIHELLHCFEGFFDSLGKMAGLHDNDKYGYKDDNGWYKWYWDILSGMVKDPATGEFVGIKADMWQHRPQKDYNDVESWSGHTYQVYNLVKSWHKAKEYCESLGGHLVTITSEAEQNIVEGLLKRASIWNYIGYWMGAQKESDWKWVTGEPFKYAKFDTNEPNGSGAYLQMYNFPNPGYWDDTTAYTNSDSDYPHGFICEWEYKRVNPTPVITTVNHLPGGVVGMPYTKTIKATGTAEITWSRNSGSLPDGLELDASGKLSGMPTQPGNYNFTLNAKNSLGYDVKTLTLAIASAPVAPSIANHSLEDGTVGELYEQGLEVEGTWPEWRLVKGNLPTDITLSAEGEITGIPSQAGTYTFTVRAENSAGHDEKEFVFAVNPEPVFPKPEDDNDDNNDEDNEDKDAKENKDNNPRPDNHNNSSQSSSGGGGCNTSFMGMLLLPFIPLLARRKR